MSSTTQEVAVSLPGLPGHHMELERRPHSHHHGRTVLVCECGATRSLYVSSNDLSHDSKWAEEERMVRLEHTLEVLIKGLNDVGALPLALTTYEGR